MDVIIERESRQLKMCADENGDIWELTGGCVQCGWCCQFHPTKPPGVPFPNIKTQKCAYVFLDENGKSACSLHHTKPFGCVVFPLPGHVVGPECGFKWQKKEKNL